MELQETYSQYGVYSDEFGKSLLNYFTSLAMKRGVPKSDFEDVVQTACLYLYKYIEKFDSSKSGIQTWANRLFQDSYADYFAPTMDALSKRRLKVSAEADVADSLEVTPLVPLEDVDKEAFNSFEENFVTRLDFKKWKLTLSVEDRRLVDLKLAGYTDEEIAQKFDTTVDGIKSRYKRLKK
jgi:RNA polymerase sigma factor (sigma-70 family)